MGLPPLLLPAFLSVDTCARFREAINVGEFSAAAVAVDGFHVDEAVRRTFEVDVDASAFARADETIAAAVPIIAEHFATRLARHEGTGFLRYSTGGFYRVHADVTPEWPSDFPRTISVIVFLTTAGEREGSDCAGGTLRLYPDRHDEPGALVFDVEPVAGTLVAFPATTPHEVLPVTRGIRDVIVDWLY
jgi:predicted 2-oxoglutarate/Fe(II)-dependent dioxygenase YbiX